MQWLIATAEPEGEDRLLLLAGIENVGGRAERQPDKFRQRKSPLKLLPRLAVGDKAGIETFDRRDKSNFGQRGLPSVKDKIGTASAQLQVRSSVNWTIGTRGELDPEQRVAAFNL